MYSLIEKPLMIEKFNSLVLFEYKRKIIVNDPALNADTLFVDGSEKGLKLFLERFIQDMKFTEKDDSNGCLVYEISAVVRAAMKKNVKYKVSMDIKQEDCTILNACCECPVGVDPAFCKHFFAVVAMLDDYAKKELYKAPTEKLQRWHQPPQKKFSPKKAEDVLAKPSSTNIKIKEPNYSALASLPGNTPIFHIIGCYQEVWYNQSIGLPAVPFGRKFSAVSTEYLSISEIIFLGNKLDLSVDDCVQLEKRTVGQAENDLWKSERKLRITSSNFKKIISCNDRPKLAQELFNPRDLRVITAVSHGQKMEPIIRNILRNKNKDKVLRKVGLVVNPIWPFLACSPDGLFYSKDEGPMLLEIKTLFNPERLSLEELSAKRQNFCLKFDTASKQFSLKEDHPYMHQVQGQMGVSYMDKCLFCVAYDRHKIFTEVIKFQPQFFKEMIPKLSDFYFKYYIKLLV